MKLSKILSLVLSFIFVFTSVIACFPGSEAMASTIELTDDDMLNAAAVLKTIAPDFPLEDKEETTRAEFVAAVALALNLPVDADIASGFADVDKANPYVKHIAYAAQMGIISNVALFYPDSSITYAQAIKIVMAAAGYTKKAEVSGGFPAGYLKAAKDAGVGDGINLGIDDTVSHEIATKLIFEACCTDMMEQTSFGSSIDYTVTEGKNILSTYHKIRIAEGIVEANENTGLDAASQATAPGTITVDGVDYKADVAGNLIGKRIRVFYNDDKAKTVVYAYAKDNTEISYTANDGVTLSGLTLTAFPEETLKETRHTLEADFKVIYNGKAYIAADYASLLNPSSGTVTIIDNDDNKKIDIVYIRKYEYGVIGSVNALEEKIFDKYKKGGLIDLSLSDINYSITDSTGAKLELSTLEPGDKIGYVMSSDEKYVEIIRCDNANGGIYTSLTGDGKIELKGKEYKLTDYYTSNVKSASNIKMGTEVILYLSPDDQVIFIQEYTSSLGYGFLVAAAQGSGLDSGVMVKIFTSGGQMLEAAVADKVVLDGTPKTSKTEIKTFLDSTIAKQYAYRVVKFSQNVEGKINKIYTATDNLEGTAVLYKQPVDEARPVIYYDSTAVTGPISDDTSDEVPYVVEKTLCPFPVRGSFSYFHAGSGTKIMRIPVRPGQFNDDENFKIISSAPEAYARTAAYDVSYGGIASFVLLSNDTSAGSIGRYDGSAIIESITQGTNEDGEALTILKLYYGGEWDKYYYHPEKTKITKESTGGDGTTTQTELTIADFAPGDIIRISADSDKLIAEMTMNFDASERTVVAGLTKTTGNNGRYVEYIKGYALGYDQSRLVVATDNTMEEIDAVGGNVDVAKTYSAALTRGTTLFVKFHRNRSTDAITSAEIYTEADASAIETYFSSGRNADYIVLRQYFRDPSLNIVYVNIDE